MAEPKPIEGADGFEFYLNPGTATPEEIADLLIALNNLHRAYGGEGLKFEVTPYRKEPDNAENK